VVISNSWLIHSSETKIIDFNNLRPYELFCFSLILNIV
jgi:hypothetical protein